MIFLNKKEGAFMALFKKFSNLFGNTSKDNNTQQPNRSHNDIKVKVEAVNNVYDDRTDRGIESKKLNDNCIRSRNGLSVGEILLLEYCKKGKYPNPQGGYQNFWWFDYGIKDVGSVLKSLENRGFIRYALPIERIETLKLSQIKDILKELEQPTTGKKAELIDRIKSSDNLSVLDKYFTENKYTLTELGENELKENEYVTYIHSHKNIEMTVWDLNKQIHQTKLGYRDIIWGNFNKKLTEYNSPNNIGLRRNVVLSMGDFACEENKYQYALQFYAEVCYYDVVYYSGFSGYDDVSDLLIPGVLTNMKKCKKEAQMSNDDLFKLMINHFSKLMTYERKVDISNQDLSGLIVSKIDTM